jgi:hypothetical protein
VKFLSDELLDGLKAAGAVFSDETAALIVAEAYLDAAGDQRAAEAMQRIRESLRESPAGLALDRVIFGPTQSQRKDAQTVGVSRTTLARQEAEIRACVPPPLQWQ